SSAPAPTPTGRRRYLAVDRANRLVAGTLEADWNTALRALTQAQEQDNKQQVTLSLPGGIFRCKPFYHARQPPGEVPGGLRP
ncbi:MAG: hypothetical protein ACRDOB_25840, partial [Streptosporangiaceae bacterium]